MKKKKRQLSHGTATISPSLDVASCVCHVNSAHLSPPNRELALSFLIRCQSLWVLVFTYLPNVCLISFCCLALGLWWFLSCAVQQISSENCELVLCRMSQAVVCDVGWLSQQLATHCLSQFRVFSGLCCLILSLCIDTCKFVLKGLVYSLSCSCFLDLINRYMHMNAEEAFSVRSVLVLTDTG